MRLRTHSCGPHSSGSVVNNNGYPTGRQPGQSKAIPYIAVTWARDWIDLALFRRLAQKARRSTAPQMLCCHFQRLLWPAYQALSRKQNRRSQAPAN
jgi:hypothetical protein